MKKLLLSTLLLLNILINTKHLHAEDSYIDYVSTGIFTYKFPRYADEYSAASSGYFLGIGKQLFDRIILEYEYAILENDEVESLDFVEVDGSLNGLHLGYITDINKVNFFGKIVDTYLVLKLGLTNQHLEMKFKKNNILERTESSNTNTTSLGFDACSILDSFHFMVNLRYYSVGDMSVQIGAKYLF